VAFGLAVATVLQMVLGELAPKNLALAKAAATAADLTELVSRHGHSRYPVVGRHIDDVLGVAGSAS
jgi:CBS domain containing-hemolysin-like protein